MANDTLFNQLLENTTEFDTKMGHLKRLRNGLQEKIKHALMHRYSEHALVHERRITIGPPIRSFELLVKYDGEQSNEVVITIFQNGIPLTKEHQWTLDMVRAIRDDIDKIIVTAAQFCDEVGCSSAFIREMLRLGVDVR